ncbi:hypothetical protein D3C80_1824820 [compost metagenome]
MPESEFNKQFKGSFGQPECWKCDIPINGAYPDHKGITQNFVNAILFDEPLIAPGNEGIKGLMLSNAMLLSTWTDGWVDLPIDEDLFHQYLEDRIANSVYNKDGER